MHWLMINVESLSSLERIVKIRAPRAEERVYENHFWRGCCVEFAFFHELPSVISIFGFRLASPASREVSSDVTLNISTSIRRCR